MKTISMEEFLTIDKPEMKGTKYLIQVGADDITVHREYKESMWRGYVIEKNHVPVCTSCRNFEEVKETIVRLYL